MPDFVLQFQAITKPFSGLPSPPLFYHLLSSPLLSSSVRQGVKYEYTVQVEADGLLSDPSSPLLYTHGQSYCGDGLIQGSVHRGAYFTVT